MNGDVVCYNGPGNDYLPMATIYGGTEVNIVGQYPGWWIIEIPGYPGTLCWVPAGKVNANDAATVVPLFAQPPRPTATPRPTREKPRGGDEEEEGGGGCPAGYYYCDGGCYCTAPYYTSP
jgi:hypothetical protein